MKCKLLFLVFFFYLFNTQAQVAISPSPTPPAASAMLDVQSTNKGILLPRIGLTSAIDNTTIPSPATSLMIFNTSNAGSGANKVAPGFYSWSGTRWQRVSNIIDTVAIATTNGYALSQIPFANGFFSVTGIANQAIPDNDATGITHTIPIFNLLTPQIYEITIGVRIIHSFDADLSIHLISPTGATIELSTNNGGSGDDYGIGTSENISFTFSPLLQEPV